jgi:type II secretory pathway component PulF
LAQSGFFPEDVIEMLDVAEAANNVDEVLESVAVSLEGRVDRGLTGATRLIEPMLLLVIGGAVAVVALALILPMTKMQ